MKIQAKPQEFVFEASSKYVSKKQGPNISTRTLRRYYADGTKAIMLAGAGTVPGSVMSSLSSTDSSLAFRILLFNHYFGMWRNTSGDPEIDRGII
jgi:hypothetical protein